MFSLNDLKPKRVPFDLDGEEIYFVTMKEFTLAQKVAWDDISERITRYKAQKEKAFVIADTAKKEARLFSIQKKYLRMLRDLIDLALPDFPKDLLDTYDYGVVDQLGAMCIYAIRGGAAQDESPSEDDIETVKNMYPDFSLDFVGTLSIAQIALLLDGDTEKNADSQLQMS